MHLTWSAKIKNMGNVIFCTAGEQQVCARVCKCDCISFPQKPGFIREVTRKKEKTELLLNVFIEFHAEDHFAQVYGMDCTQKAFHFWS